MFFKAFISRAAPCNKIVTEENIFRVVGRISISMNQDYHIEDDILAVSSSKIGTFPLLKIDIEKLLSTPINLCGNRSIG